MIPCNIFKGNFLIVGIGSPLRSDDQAGLILCDILNQNGVNCIKCEYGFENCVDIVIEKSPEKLVIIDTAIFSGGNPGDVIFLDSIEAFDSTCILTTHNIPIGLLLNTIKELSSIREVYIIGIYPRNLEIGLEVSREVTNSLHILAESIVKCFKNI
ncbi:MAG: hydrogenase maturation protease [Desulfurococcaceae archaeon]|nr:hydrogenase maturation protease [Desulfurococcaceae archaeon]